MLINTKYDVGDKVWFYVDYLNQYAWGKIESMDVSIRSGKVASKYYLKNRYYKGDEYQFLSTDYDHRNKFYLKYHSIISFDEKELFETVDDLKNNLEKEHRDKMNDLTETKKKWF